jgi:hypothetical protein
MPGRISNGLGRGAFTPMICHGGLDPAIHAAGALQNDDFAEKADIPRCLAD